MDSAATCTIVDDILLALQSHSHDDSTVKRAWFEKLLIDYPRCAQAYALFANFELEQGNRKKSEDILKTAKKVKAEPRGLIVNARENLWNGESVIGENSWLRRRISSSNSSSDSQNASQDRTADESLRKDLGSHTFEFKDQVGGEFKKHRPYLEELSVESNEMKRVDTAVAFKMDIHHVKSSSDVHEAETVDAFHEVVQTILEAQRSKKLSAPGVPQVSTGRKARRRRPVKGRSTKLPSDLPMRVPRGHMLEPACASGSDNDKEIDLAKKDDCSLPARLEKREMDMSKLTPGEKERGNTVCGTMSPVCPTITTRLQPTNSSLVQPLPASTQHARQRVAELQSPLLAAPQQHRMKQSEETPGLLGRQQSKVLSRKPTVGLEKCDQQQRDGIKSTVEQDEHWGRVGLGKDSECPINNKHRESSRRLCVSGQTYEIVGQLGKGGSSQVFSAMPPCDMYCNRDPVAVKCVNLHGINDRAVRQSFFNEIAVLDELNKGGCKHIIKLLTWEYREEDMMIYIVMEKGDTDLSTILRQEKDRLPIWSIKSLWNNMLKAVQEIHKFRIIHSDLKPANFIVVNGFSLKLIDFGIADKLENDTTSIQRDLEKGTPNYMAPETIRANFNGRAQIKVGPASDVWSLGCILYSMVYGHTPFSHIKQMKLLAIADHSTEIEFPPLPHQYAVDVLKACLKRDPTQRATIAELLTHPFLRESSALPPSRPSAQTTSEVQQQVSVRRSQVRRQRPLAEINSNAIQAARACLKPLAESASGEYSKKKQPQEPENMGIETMLRKGLEQKYKNALPGITEITEQSAWSCS